MSLEELMAVVRPPAKRPAVGGIRKWMSMEKKMGIRFPDDFREFGLRYGSGTFSENPGHSRMMICFPFDADYDSLLTMNLGIMVELRQNGLEGLLPMFPEKNGFVTWCWEDNSFLFGWLTKGPPNKWPTIVRGREGQIVEFKMPMTTLLTKIITLQIQFPEVGNTLFVHPKKVRFSRRKPKKDHFGPSSLF